MAGKVALLLWGAQTTQLLVEPPWRLAVLWDRVTLTCQGSGATGATTWYKDRQNWGQERRNKVTVTESGTYECDGLRTRCSPPVALVPAQALLEGDMVTLRCRNWKNKQLKSVYFYHGEKQMKGPHDGTELSLSPLQLHHSGHYRGRGRVASYNRKLERVTVTVHRLPPLGVSLSVQSPRGQVALGDHLVLSGVVAVGTGPLSFSWHQEGSGALLGTSPHLDLCHIGDNDSGHRHEEAEKGPPGSPSPPEEGEVLYTHVVVTKRAGVSPRATTLQDPQVTYAELRGPQGRPQEPGDIYGNVL
ncbi:low affinity immunoglobulin gamma Fc region receptor II-like [Geothlypis trichas]